MEQLLTAGGQMWTVVANPLKTTSCCIAASPHQRVWYDPATGVLNSEAFGPHKTRDTSGLSVPRAKYKSIEEAAHGQPGKSYFVAVLRAGDLRQRGIDVVPRPVLPDGRRDPAHAELPDLNGSVRKADQTLERQRILAE